VTSSFSKYEDFAGLVRPEGMDMKPVLLRVLTDLYIQKPAHSLDEEKHFTELALRLIEEVDAQTLITTAARLDAYGAAPAPVMRRLAVKNSMNATVPESGTVGDIETPRRAASGPPTLDTDRAAAAHFSELFFTAGAVQRRTLFERLAAGNATLLPLLTAADAEAATARLEAAALKGRPFEFVREIEQSLGIPRACSEKIVTDVSGEPMLAIARVLSMPIDVLQRILLLLNPAIGNSVRRVFDLTALYENLPEQAALRLVTLWRYAGVRLPPHQPVATAAADPRVPAAQHKPLATAKRDQRAS
jgi:hypothetical protein